jgi:hypothetical protein
VPEDAAKVEPLDTEAWPEHDVVARWRADGYTKDYQVVPGGAIDCGCDETHPAETYTVDHQFRYEGVSNPADEELLVAARAACGCRGVLTLAYGPAAGEAEAEAARRLPAPRRR